MTQQNKQVHVPYGVGIAVVMILITVVLRVANLEEKAGAQYAAMAPLLAGVVMNCFAYSKANNRFVTFGQTFGSAFKAIAIATLLMIAWAFASLYIWPETMSEALSKAADEMEKGKNVSQDDIDKMLAFTRDNFKTLMIAGVLFSTMFFGVIFALIGAAIAPKNGSSARPEILDSPNTTRL